MKSLRISDVCSQPGCCLPLAKWGSVPSTNSYGEEAAAGAITQRKGKKYPAKLIPGKPKVDVL